jgi:hypothetical protein
MNTQDVANSLNALCKLEVAAAAVSSSGWAGLAEAAGRTAREMNPQNVANTLNALCKLEVVRNLPAGLFPSSWDAYNSHLTQMLRPTIAVAAADGYLR